MVRGGRRHGVLAVLACLVLALCACAGKGGKPVGPTPTGFASADAKNVHDFMARYPGVVMSGEVKAIRRLYTEDARVVPFLGNFIRPVRSQDMKKQLPAIVAEERKADMRLAFHEPMAIQVKGTAASVQVVADMSWQEGGQPRQAVLNCYFGLTRDEHYLWKIREAHAEPVQPGFTLPPQAAPKKPLPPRDPKLRSPKGKARPVKVEPVPEASAPPAPSAPPAGPSAPQDAGASPGAIVPDEGQAPRPLF